MGILALFLYVFAICLLAVAGWLNQHPFSNRIACWGLALLAGALLMSHMPVLR